MAIQKIAPHLWFDGQGEEAARFYVSIFPNSRVIDVVRFPDAGRELHGGKPGSVMSVLFELDGLKFHAMNGGPQFKFTEAISLMVTCETQAEIDRYWDALTAGGDAKAQRCGWLKDKHGLCWQVVPAQMHDWLAGADAAASARVMEAFLKMKKIDLAKLAAARDG